MLIWTGLIGPLPDCLTPDSARRVLVLKADRKLQAHVNRLVDCLLPIARKSGH